MIRIVQGNPGSGKSYYAVNYLSKYTKYDALYQEHVLNDGVLVITNIEGLRIKHLNLFDLIERYGVEKFFTVENFERIQEKYRVNHIVIVIDEAQKIFDSKFYDKDVFYFFQYHRHLGIDIFLLTQSVSTIARQLIPLCEFVIEAQPRSKGFMGVFRYKFKDVKGNFMYSQVARKKPELFKMYQSFKSDEAEKPRNVIAYWAVVGVVLVVIAGVGFKLAIAGISNQGKKKAKPAITKTKETTSNDSVMVAMAQEQKRSDVPAAAVPVMHDPRVEIKPYWERVPVSGRVRAGATDYVMLTNGTKVTRYKEFDAYTSTALIPATLAARLPVSGGEPVTRESDAKTEAAGGVAPGKQGAALATPDARQTGRM